MSKRNSHTSGKIRFEVGQFRPATQLNRKDRQRKRTSKTARRELRCQLSGD